MINIKYGMAFILREIVFLLTAATIFGSPPISNIKPVPSHSHSTSNFHDMALIRLASGEHIPLTYFATISDLFTNCLAQRPVSQPADVVCRDMKEDAASLDFKKVDIAISVIKSLRVKIWKSLPNKEPVSSLLKDPNLLEKIGFLAHLDTGDLFTQSINSFAWEHHGRDFSRMLEKMRLERISIPSPDSGDWNNFSLQERIGFLWEMVVPNLKDHLNLRLYISVLPQLNTLWNNVEVQNAYRDYRIAWLSGLTRRSNLSTQALWFEKTLFNHKLKNLLSDAVWDVRDPMAFQLPLSAFFFNRKYQLTPADSFFIVSELRQFGKKNMSLAHRIDPADTSTWKNIKTERLERLVLEATTNIQRGLGQELKNFLDRLPEETVEFVVSYSEVPDLFNGLDSSIAKLIERRGTFNIQSNQFPLAPSFHLEACGHVKETNKTKAKSKRFGCLDSLDVGIINLLNLTFSKTEPFYFLGTYARLKNLLELKAM